MPKRAKTEHREEKAQCKPVEWVRPMPLYLVTRIIQQDYLWEDSAHNVTVWQLRHEDPLAQTYEGLTEEQHRKVRDLFYSIRKTALHKAVIVTDNELSFLGEGGKDCGPYGTKGLTEMDYVLEHIAIRMSPDDTLVKRPAVTQEPLFQNALHPLDLINGKVAFVEFLE